MIGTTARRLTQCGFWLVFTLVVSAGAIWATLEHYMSTRGALELAGFEKQELWRDPLLGPILGPFIPNATLPEAMALSLAVLEAVIFFLIFHALFESLWLIRHRRIHSVRGNTTEVAEAEYRMLVIGVTMVFASILLVPAIRWDMELFRFRSLAGAMGIEQAVDAAHIKALEAKDSVANSLFSHKLAWIGAWGYMAVMAIGSLALERCFNKLNEHFTLLMSPLGIAPVTPPAVTSPPPARTAPTGSPNRLRWRDRIAGGFGEIRNRIARVPTTARKRDQGTLTKYSDNSTEETRTAHQQPTNASSIHADPGAPNNRQVGDGTVQANPPSVSMGDRIPVDPATCPPAARGAEPALRVVIGSTSRERVSLSAAVRDPKKYYIDHSTGRIWNRQHHDSIFPTPADPKPKGKSR